jgi:hypothetical protein
MPHGDHCPHCKERIQDWYLEWYTKTEQIEIVKQKLAMDCPLCYKPVIIKNHSIHAAPPHIPMKSRGYQEATRYVQRPALGYTSLEDFLRSPLEELTAKPFRIGYWPNVNIASAGSQP